MKQLRFVVVMFMTLTGLASASWAQDMSAQYYAAGNTYYAQKNYDLAIRYYQGAVQTNPNSWQSYQGMGNCYYGKGDSANALVNYQKALSINPNNPQLASFVQSLQAQAGTPAPAAATASNTATSPSAAMKPTGAASAKSFELDPMAGIALSSSGGYGLGFGGGVAGYFPAGNGLFIGGSVGFYTFSNTITTQGGIPSYYSSTQVSNGNWTNIEILASGKYRFEGNGMKPYLLGGAGLSMFGVSSSGSTTYTLDPPYNTPYYEALLPNTSYSTPGGSSIYPTIQVGGGVELPMGPDMNIFGEAKYTLIIGQGGTAGYIPIEVGLNINI